jgi:hypothetical protein
MSDYSVMYECTRKAIDCETEKLIYSERLLVWQESGIRFSMCVSFQDRAEDGVVFPVLVCV